MKSAKGNVEKGTKRIMKIKLIAVLFIIACMAAVSYGAETAAPAK